MDRVILQGSGSDLVSVWLRTSLSDAHDDILEAPLPADLVRLAMELFRFP